MKFCKFCGKQLADDEVCSCQEGKTSQTAIKESPITQIVNLVKGTLDKPESAAKNFYYKGSIAATGILVGVLTLTFILATLFNMIHASVVYHKYLDGAFVSGEMVVKVIFFPIVYIIVMAIAYFGLTYLARLLFKQKFDYEMTINLCGATIVPLIAAQLVQMLDNVINVGALNAIFGAIVAFLGFVTLFQGIHCIKDEFDSSKKLIGYVGFMILGLCLANYLIRLLMNTSAIYVGLAF